MFTDTVSIMLQGEMSSNQLRGYIHALMETVGIHNDLQDTPPFQYLTVEAGRHSLTCELLKIVLSRGGRIVLRIAEEGCALKLIN